MVGLQCVIFLYLIPKSYEVGTLPLVELNMGLIRGVRSNDGYSMFMGIPYAIVDRNNPFGMAVPYPKFDGVFKANDDTAVCPQLVEFNKTITGTLDCLRLNIYVPDSATTTNKLPVLIWIHGGGFDHGFSGRYLYGPKYLIRHGIILVTINYRVGIYGFMCLHIPEVPGNAGLKDQVLAFEWIRDNIKAFGGDPGQVTIYGMSASGLAVDVHYLFEKANLFHKIIMHSGTAMNPNIVGNPDTAAALKLAKHFGFETKENIDALKYLARVDPIQVISATKALDINLGLCVEMEFYGIKRYVNDIPYNVRRDASNKSILVAYNRDELQSFFARMVPESFPGLRNVIRKDLKNYFQLDPASLDKYEAIVRHFYMGDESFTEKIRSNLGRYASDLQYIHPTMRTIRRYVKDGCKNVYHFVFSYCGNRNFVKSRFDLMHLDIVVHADEVGYLFDVSYMGQPTARDQLAIDRITTLWANFVKYGNPTPQRTKLLPVIWQTATDKTLPYLELDSEVRVGKAHCHDRVAFWDLFYELNWEAQNDKPFITFRYNGNGNLKSTSVVILNILSVTVFLH